ncbi:MAG TPA: biopolymer transporter ExbD [Tepidisphaeraceae bacterium]|nr:biopolymer transporter ExbD [Tepidisphaeraceae bacterium]
MRRHRGMPPIREGSVNVTPLIDIVMCLIVFFMLVAKIGVTTGAEAEIEIPVTQLGRDIMEIGIESALVLNVREVADQPFVTALVESDGSISKTGKPVELKVVDPVSGQRVLAEALKRLRFGRDGKPGGVHENADNPEFKVIIRGDKGISYATLEPVLRACMEANVKNVNFNTKKTG